MTESKPTRGHYTFVHQFNVECDRRGIANCGGYSPSHGQQEAFEENKANALLVADAFNVYNETGLTPRQLYDELKRAEDNHERFYNECGRLQHRCEKLENSRNILLTALEQAIKLYRIPQSYFKGHPEHSWYDEVQNIIAFEKNNNDVKTVPTKHKGAANV